MLKKYIFVEIITFLAAILCRSNERKTRLGFGTPRSAQFVTLTTGQKEDRLPQASRKALHIETMMYTRLLSPSPQILSRAIITHIVNNISAEAVQCRSRPTIIPLHLFLFNFESSFNSNIQIFKSLCHLLRASTFDVIKKGVFIS